MLDQQVLIDKLKDRFNSSLNDVSCQQNMVTVELAPAQLLDVCTALRDDPIFKFETLIDVCAIDYLDYGLSQWRGEETTNSGYSRGVIEEGGERVVAWDKPRFAVVYHLLSLSNNCRLRLKVYVDGEPALVPSVINVWSSANWFEREVFDLMGIVFDGHSDLRRILTDYGFVGHPFRKDFPLVGQVELRYDAALQRCIYEPVSIQPRVLVPKVIRDDNRYHQDPTTEGEQHNG